MMRSLLLVTAIFVLATATASRAQDSGTKAQQLLAENAVVANEPVDDPWKDWIDDTAEFNAQVAATVNGEPILTGIVLDRYSEHLLATRVQLQDIAKKKRKTSDGEEPTPEYYRKLRAGIVQSNLYKFIEETALVQHLMAHTAPDQRNQLGKNVGEVFQVHMQQMMRQMNASSVEDLESKLQARGADLQRINGTFLLGEYSRECIILHSQEAVAASDQEVQQYYKDYGERFDQHESVDIEQIELRFSSPADQADAKAQLEEIRGLMNQGATFKDVADRFSTAKGLIMRSEFGVRPVRLSDHKLQAQVRTMPLNQWGEVLEQHPAKIESTEITRLHIVCVTSRTEAHRKPFEMVRTGIQDTLIAQRRQMLQKQFVAEVMANATIETSYRIPQLKRASDD